MTYSKFNPILFLISLLLISLSGLARADEVHKHAATDAKTSGVDAAKLYHDFCSVCHGDRGDGRSQAQSGLNPPPKNFTSHKVAAELTRERMIRSISEGRPGTAMSGWSKRLGDEEIAALADFIRTEFMPAVTTDDSDTGRAIYAKNCSVCHGDRGQGAIWARSGLTPPPANFTDPALANLSRDRMIFSVTYGRPQTAMSAWGKRFSAEEIEAVVDYIRTSFMHVRTQAPANNTPQTASGHDHDAHGPADIMAPLPMGLIGNAKMGGDLYQQNCADCHGISGDGQGPRAYFIFPKPRDFRHPAARAKYSRAHLFEVISDGVVGSEMPAWDKVMTDQEIAHISEYVFDAFIHQPAAAELPAGSHDHGQHTH
ncbi:c-type cytochrome [Motiliproteus sediminis]|uniref:c-type cytochrome n=1 Tax=Motiliproteus sediminis TaxID=1468178 RepID=UPI001AEF9CDA|nr:c-type cytochrome [Motiliproteus sediminis]